MELRTVTVKAPVRVSTPFGATAAMPGPAMKDRSLFLRMYSRSILVTIPLGLQKGRFKSSKRGFNRSVVGRREADAKQDALHRPFGACRDAYVCAVHPYVAAHEISVRVLRGFSLYNKNFTAVRP